LECCIFAGMKKKQSLTNITSIQILFFIILSVFILNVGSNDTASFSTLTAIFIKGNFDAYQISMAAWGIGGLLLCYLLYNSKLVPRALSVWGIVGYRIFIIGTIFGIFGYNIDAELDAFGRMLEIFLTIWLVIKEFNITPIIPALQTK